MTQIERIPLRLVGAEGMPIRGCLHVAPQIPAPDFMSGQRHELGLASGEDDELDSSASENRPIVVFVHGFKGFQDWGPWASMCDRLAEAGFDAIRFDLSHNGVGDDGVDFSALHLFERNTISMELFDIGVVLGAIPVSKEPRPVILVGHSRGAADAIVAGGWLLLNVYPPRLEERLKLIGVAAWAPIRSFFRPWPAVFYSSWEAGECGEIPNMRTGQIMLLGPDMQRDLEENSARLSVYQGTRALARARVPLLVVHGAADTSVPITEGRRIREVYRREAAAHSLGGEGTCRWVPIEHAEHTFGAVHPFAGWTPALEIAFQATLDFIRFASCPIIPE